MPAAGVYNSENGFEIAFDGWRADRSEYGLVVEPGFAQTRVEPEQPPLIGRMVDLGGCRLHLDCGGNGEPTVVLSAGAGGFSTDWVLVQSKVVAFTRVCSYDRGGAAWSDLGPKPRTLDQEAFDLYRLLKAAREHGPYVMVGQSLGGMVVRIFTDRHPEEVVGVVLVDSYSEDAQLFTNGAMRRMRLIAQNRQIPAPRTTISSADLLTSSELHQIEDELKNMASPKIGGLYQKLPEYAQRVRLWAAQQPQYYARDDDYLAEISARMYAESQGDKHPLGDRLLIVLTRDKYDYPGPNAGSLMKEHQEQQARMAQLSSRGSQIIVPNSAHEIHLDAPDAVVDAIRKATIGAGNEGEKSR